MRTAQTGSKMWIWVLLAIVAACPACAEERARDAGAPTKDAAPDALPKGDCLISALRSSFQQKNSKLTQVGVLDLKAWDFLGPRLVLGWAIVGDKVFRGDFNDEMFGVFVVDESLTRVERVVDTFPTRSWFDYDVRFGRFTADSVEVVGRSTTHGDDPTRRVYKWR